MTYIRIFSLLMILGLINTSCKKDEITTETNITAGNASVLGTVLIDSDGDKVGDIPFVGETVYLVDTIYFHNTSERLEHLITTLGESEDLMSTTVDADGNYAFSGLAPFERKFLVFDHPDYIVEGFDTTEDGDEWEFKTVNAIRVALEEGEVDDGNDFVATLKKESISGSVFSDNDNDGVGDIPFTAIVVLHENAGGVLGDEIDWVWTDEEGNYTFYNIAAGEYALRLDNTFYEVVSAADATPDPDGSASLPLEQIDVVLEEGEHDEDNDFVVLDPKNRKISGYVLVDTDEDLLGDEPVPSHRVELYLRNADGVPISTTGGPIKFANTSSEGYYEFTNLEFGEYVIYHIGNGTTPVGYDLLVGEDLSPEAGEPTDNPNPFFIATNLSEDVQIDRDNVFLFGTPEPPVPASLQGSIYEDITSDGQPDVITDLIIDVEIYARASDGLETGPVLYTTTSDANGNFSFEGLLPGEYVVALNTDSGEFNTIFGRAQTGLPHPRPEQFPVDVRSGEDITGAYFWIFTLDNMPSIRGRVLIDVDGDGIGDDPSYDHWVELYARGSDGFPTGELLYRTGTNGSFFFTNLTTDEYVLVLADNDEYTCITSLDESPEPGEPTLVLGCEYIAVDFVEGQAEDRGNLYLVR